RQEAGHRSLVHDEVEQGLQGGDREYLARPVQSRAAIHDDHIPGLLHSDLPERDLQVLWRTARCAAPPRTTRASLIAFCRLESHLKPMTSVIGFVLCVPGMLRLRR